MKLKNVLAGVALAGVLSVSLGGAVMAADGDCDESCLRKQERSWERICGETCARLQNRSCEKAGEVLDETAAAADENASEDANQAGNSYGEYGEGTGPGLNHQYGKSAH